MRYLTTCILILLICNNSVYSYQSEKNYSAIEGYVYDLKTREPLIGANVYISNSLLGSGSNTDGSYKIYNIPPGIYQLVVSYVGYEVKQRRIVVEENESYNYKFWLKQKVHELDEFTITGKIPKDWKKNLRKFTKEFIGISKNAKYCEIKNPEVLSFNVDGRSETFKATAEDMIRVENRALGYTVNIALIEFIMNKGFFRFKIEPQFQELKPEDDSEYDKWMKNRSETYQGSIRHFLASLIRYDLKESGFEIERTDAPPPEDYFSFTVSEDSLFVFNKTHNNLELDFEGFLKVRYLPGKIVSKSKPYLYNQFVKRTEAYQNTNIQIPTSGIILKDYPVLFSYNGYLYDSYKIDQYGAWALYRIADLLPIEYLPDKN